MRTLVIVDKPSDWPLELPGIEVVPAGDYLTGSQWSKARGLRIFNICRSYRYQTAGYYVSLLAAARGHRPFPGLMTVLDMKSRAVVRTMDGDLEDIIHASLGELRSERFDLSIYFGQNLAARHARLARRLFALFPAPLIRATFARGERWRLTGVTPIALRDVPEPHLEFLRKAAKEYFAKPRYRTRQARSTRYDLAILQDPAEELAPSDPKALARFRAAGEKLGFSVEMIGREDYGRLAEFDALFIRETTAVNHHTFRFAQRAEAEGLVVVDDPQSILRCTNKVFQTEAFKVAGVPTPPTWITDRIEPDEVARRIGFPCVLKYPDSAFSQGVLKCEGPEDLQRLGAGILEASELLLVQGFVPSDFDWRIGVFDGEPLYACRYHMAKGHWQIVKRTGSGGFRYGRVEPIPVEQVPEDVVRVGLRAAATIGDGLYGVDLKQFGDELVVTEVNDNPNINAGCEDAVLKDGLYTRILGGLLARIEARKRGGVA